ncbi:type II secretion system protein F [Luteitalea sp. TBR-22]|uniref:type II secretion system F family protein n=1 Tax=Luteitalea sp. TBR-22 TaxID=2802971 RepID=UPI001AFA8A01|nr:type II secretion system F family protein [Luteitalea sp. TBR-22]BCS34567.1 type II secretion system protein F [Luteitalea sp. TBR-22]
MQAFAFSGRTRAGETINGERQAESLEAAVAALRREQILITRIDPVKARAAKALAKSGGKVPAKSLAIFTRQFSVMIDAGLPLVQCLDILGRQEPHKGFAATILKTREDVESGMSLAEAMRKHPRTFDALFTNMIQAGEAGGILDTILKRLATYIEKNVRLISQVKSAMIYPVAVIVIAALVVAVILWKVIPTFAQMFAGLGAKLPLPTRIVIAMSNGLVSYGAFIIMGLAAIAFAIRAYYRTNNGRHTIDSLLLRLPILGIILRKVAVARFCRTLSTLMSSGVPLLDGLEITARTAGNAIIEDAIMETRASIERGETVSKPLQDTKVFPAMVTQMIGVGEATGALDMMLAKIADFYEDEVDTAVAGLLTLIEPIMISFLGVVVGGIVISMYLPIFDLISKLT